VRVPRADILQYAFVLAPIAELAPDLRHPVDGRTMRELWSAFEGGDQGIRRLAEPLL
jgi:2-amino-4-hydroxy-6-hydroxymethyldihydropteridine diphosphokinase